MLTVVTNTGFAKLDTFQFEYVGGIVGNMTIDFGDGNVEFLTNSVFTHVYDDFGIYNVQVKLCGETIDTCADPSNCLKICVEPFVKDQIVIEDYTLSSYSSFETSNFLLCLSSNCEPPLRVNLSLSGGDELPHISEYTDYTKGCDPTYYFKDNNGEIIQDGIIEFHNPDKIFVNGDLCGHRDVTCFSLYTDGVGEYNICAELLNDCFGCKDLSIDYDECPPCNYYYKDYYDGDGYLEMIDVDIL